MQGILRQHQPGFFKTLAGSLLLHILVISLGLVVFKAEPRTFLTPVYTVDIVTAPAKHNHPPANNAVNTPGPAPAEPAHQTKETAKVKEPPPTAKKETLKIKPERPKEAATVDEALKKIERDVKRKDESALVDSRIEALKKKQAAESKYLSERIDELKKEIKSKENPPPRGSASAQPGAGKASPKAGGPVLKDPGSAYPAYYSIIRDKVQEQWIYPEGFKDDKVSVIVSIKIARSGKLLDSWIEKSSGNRRFDESLLDAIKKASPFPPLPEDFEGSAFETGFRFCPGCPR